jgi:hypothetical protein
VTETADIIRALSDPAIYPERTSGVAVAQTQMSVVFLTDAFAYKIKKPVDLGYLDYTSLAKRKHFCDQEVKLNRRLCRDAYLGVLPINMSRGMISIGGGGETIEYAVKMRRLPQDRMMDALLAGNGVTLEMMDRVAATVADFHTRAKTSPAISKFGSIEAITVNAEENFSQAAPYVGRALSRETYERIAGQTRDFIASRPGLLASRVDGRMIKDCHGDLHAQHICFVDGICIYDCIEFNDRFRYTDVASEVAFLAMDLDHWDRQDLSDRFVREYVSRRNDEQMLLLLNFYKCYRAMVRAKVNCFRLDDALLSAEAKAKALREAQEYFRLAEEYTRQSG